MTLREYAKLMNDTALQGSLSNEEYNRLYNGTRSAVNNIGQLLLCHAAGFSSPLDGEPYIVKIKASFISFYLHNIT